MLDIFNIPVSVIRRSLSTWSCRDSLLDSALFFYSVAKLFSNLNFITIFSLDGRISGSISLQIKVMWSKYLFYFKIRCSEWRNTIKHFSAHLVLDFVTEILHIFLDQKVKQGLYTFLMFTGNYEFVAKKIEDSFYGRTSQCLNSS